MCSFKSTCVVLVGDFVAVLVFLISGSVDQAAALEVPSKLSSDESEVAASKSASPSASPSASASSSPSSLPSAALSQSTPPLGTKAPLQDAPAATPSPSTLPAHTEESEESWKTAHASNASTELSKSSEPAISKPDSVRDSLVKSPTKSDVVPQRNAISSFSVDSRPGASTGPLPTAGELFDGGSSAANQDDLRRGTHTDTFQTAAGIRCKLPAAVPFW
eukprot:6183116-Pleurochrysis_carterae.AAC.1